MLSTTPTTVLEAINLMLSTIGEAPVNTVENTGVIDAVTAKMHLSTINREVQSRGWYWNTEHNVKITPTHPEHFIILPSNTLRIIGVNTGRTNEVTQRGKRLYDKTNHTYSFDTTVSVDLTLLLGFEELPEAARYYITIRAARKFQESVLGSGELSQFSLRDEIMAKVTLEDAEASTANYNILDTTHFMEIMRR